MTHIIVESSDIADGTLRITGKDYNHIRNVLRMRPGEEISVSCGDGKEYRFGITSFEEEAVLCKLRFIKEKDAELPVQVTLFQGLPKADKMDLIVQKAVELGVYEIVPVECRRTIVKLDEAKKKKRVERWQTIAESAAEQSHRSIVPKVRMPVTMEEAIGLAKDSTQYRFIPYELQGQEGTRALMEEIEEGSGTHYAPFLPELLNDPGVKRDIEYLLSKRRRKLYTDTFLLLKNNRIESIKASRNTT